MTLQRKVAWVPAPDFAVTEQMLRDGVKIRKGKKVFHKAMLA